jgi:pimeloyl-ACP methyl ester carboxylesterase
MPPPAAPARARGLVLVDSGHIDWGDSMPEQAGRPLEAWIEDARSQSPTWPAAEALLADAREGAARWSPAIERALLAGVAIDEDGVRSAASPETRGAALHGAATTRASDAWPAVASAGLPVLLLLATRPPHGDQDREHIGRFQEAVPAAEVRWVPDASHALITDAGPALGDEIDRWLRHNIQA